MKKNVLLITDQLRVGGGETYFFKIENNINRKNINLYTAAEDGELIHRLRKKENFNLLKKSKLKSIIIIKRIIDKNNIELIHANSLRISMISLVARILCRKKPKIVYTKHNLTYLEIIGDRFFAFYINRFIDKILTVCDLDKLRMIEKGIKEDRIVSIPNGTDTNELNFNPHYLKRNDYSSLNVGILARLSEVKNHELFLKIIEEFNKENIFKINGFIAGDGELRSKLENEIKEKNLNIKMLGNIDKPQNFLKDMDILLLTSYREVFPMTILEGLSVGNIVISTNVGGVSDVIKNEETGYLIEDNLCNEFKKKIKDAFLHIERNKRIIVKGRRVVEGKFSIESMMNNIENLYLGGIE